MCVFTIELPGKPSCCKLFRFQINTFVYPTPRNGVLKARQEHRVLPIATDYPPLRQTAYGGSRDQPIPGFP